jgi:hypothetical protein
VSLLRDLPGNVADEADERHEQELAMLGIHARTRVESADYASERSALRDARIGAGIRIH